MRISSQRSRQSASLVVVAIKMWVASGRKDGRWRVSNPILLMRADDSLWLYPKEALFEFSRPIAPFTFCLSFAGNKFAVEPGLTAGAVGLRSPNGVEAAIDHSGRGG
jgi:hypothetical protein